MPQFLFQALIYLNEVQNVKANLGRKPASLCEQLYLFQFDQTCFAVAREAQRPKSRATHQIPDEATEPPSLART